MGFKTLKDLLARNIKQGGSPQELSASVALGSVLGLFPIPGVATLLCLAAAMLLRLNLVLLQAVNYAVYPLQIGMLGVYYALASWWFGPISGASEMGGWPDLARLDLLAGLSSAGQIVLPVIAAWLLTSPLIGFTLYGMVRPAILRLMPADTCRRSTPGRPAGRQRRKLCAEPISG